MHRGAGLWCVGSDPCSKGLNIQRRCTKVQERCRKCRKAVKPWYDETMQLHSDRAEPMVVGSAFLLMAS